MVLHDWLRVKHVNSNNNVMETINFLWPRRFQALLISFIWLSVTTSKVKRLLRRD